MEPVQASSSENKIFHFVTLEREEALCYVYF